MSKKSLVDAMNKELFTLGIFVLGVTFLHLSPTAMIKSWKEVGAKPVGGDMVVLMMRVLGATLLIFAGAVVFGLIDLGVVPVSPGP